MADKTIGRNIQMYRNIRGLTQKELAEKVDATTGTMSHIRKGTRKPSLDMLYSIAAALNVSVINLVLDDVELERFYFDEQVQAMAIGSEKLYQAIEVLKANGKGWDKVKNVAIINLDELENKK